MTDNEKMLARFAQEHGVGVEFRDHDLWFRRAILKHPEWPWGEYELTFLPFETDEAHAFLRSLVLHRVGLAPRVTSLSLCVPHLPTLAPASPECRYAWTACAWAACEVRGASAASV